MKTKNYLFILSILMLVGCSANIKNNQVATTTETSSDIYEIPIQSLSKNIQKYSYDIADKQVNVLAVLGSDNMPRVAFDGCVICGGYKGYSQSGNDVVCNNCGRHFSIDDLGSKNMGGGCWPAHIDFRIEKDKILLTENELEKGGNLFY